MPLLTPRRSPEPKFMSSLWLLIGGEHGGHLNLFLLAKPCFPAYHLSQMPHILKFGHPYYPSTTLVMADRLQKLSKVKKWHLNCQGVKLRPKFSIQVQGQESG
jgi:hypothetical protein